MKSRNNQGGSSGIGEKAIKRIQGQSIAGKLSFEKFPLRLNALRFRKLETWSLDNSKENEKFY